MICYIQSTPRKYRFAPRIDGKSLVLQSGTDGGVQEATINATAMSDNSVVLWDNGNKRLKTTGVSNTEVQYLNGASVGTVVANKVVVANASKDVTGFRNVTLTGALSASSASITNALTSKTLTVAEQATTGNLKVTGRVIANLRLYNVNLTSFYNNADRVVVSRDGANLLLGNTSDTLRLYTASSAHVYHRKGTNNYKIWDENNDGPDSGLDADTIDGIQGNKLVRTDADVNMYGNVIMHSKALSLYREDTSTRLWNIQLYPSADHFAIHSVINNQAVFYMHHNGNAWFAGDSLHVGGNLVMHAGNDGAGSGFDADLLDGQEGAYYRNQANITGTEGTGVIVRKSVVTAVSTALSSYETSVNQQISTINSSISTLNTNKANRNTYYFQYITANYYIGSLAIEEAADTLYIDFQNGGSTTRTIYLPTSTSMASYFGTISRAYGFTIRVLTNIKTTGKITVARYYDWDGNYKSTGQFDMEKGDSAEFMFCKSGSTSSSGHWQIIDRLLS